MFTSRGGGEGVGRRGSGCHMISKQTKLTNTERKKAYMYCRTRNYMCVCVCMCVCEQITNLSWRNTEKRLPSL